MAGYQDLISGGLSLLGGQQASGITSGAADRIAGMTAYNPYDVMSGLGTGTFQDGQATAALSPQMQQFSNLFGQQAMQGLGYQPDIGQITGMGQQALGLGQGFLGQLGTFDPMQAAGEQFGRMESILAPGRQLQTEGLESKLLRQGRLGSTGGSLQQQALSGAHEQSRTQGLYDAFGQAQAAQQNLLGMGQGLTSLGLPMAGYGQQQGMQNLQQMIGLEQLPLQQLQMGGGFGTQQSQAGARGAQYIYDAAQQEADAQAALFSGIGGLFL